MAVIAGLVSLCIAIAPCNVGMGPSCQSQIASNIPYPRVVRTSRDDSLAAVVTNSDGLRVYTLSTGDAWSTPAFGESYDAAFSPDAASVAVAHAGGLSLVNLATGAEVWAASSHGRAFSVAYSPDGTRIACGYRNGDVRIWDAATGALVTTITGQHSNQVLALSYTADGAKLISGANDADAENVAVWDATTGDRLAALRHTGRVRDIALSPNGEYFAIVTDSRLDGTVIRRIDDRSVHLTVPRMFDVIRLSFSSNSANLAVSGSSATVVVYSVSSGMESTSYTMSMLFTSAMTFLHGGNMLLTASWQIDSALFLWGPGPPPAPTVPRAQVDLLRTSGAQTVPGQPATGSSAVLPHMVLSEVPAALRGSMVHSAQVAVGEKLRLSCASGSCEFIVALYSCKRCDDAANDFEAQLVAEGFVAGTCAPTFSVGGGVGHVMRTFSSSVLPSDPVVLDAVMHGVDYMAVFAPSAGVPKPWCPPKVFTGPSPACRCVSP